MAVMTVLCDNVLVLCGPSGHSFVAVLLPLGSIVIHVLLMDSPGSVLIVLLVSLIQIDSFTCLLYRSP